MAFGGMIQTNKGRNLQAKAQTGTIIEFSRIAVGDGEIGSQSITDLNSLINEIDSLDIIKLRTMPEGKAVVGSVLSNQDIESGFYFREIGVFAIDPDEGEVLYCYGNAGEDAEYIPSPEGPDIIEKVIDIITIIGDVENVTATIDDSLAYITVNRYEEEQGTIELETDAIQVRPAINELKNKKIENIANTPGIISRPESELPSAEESEEGTIFISSDSRKIFRNSGSEWIGIGVASWEDLEDKPDLNFVEKSGDDMTGDLNMQNNSINFGDRFRIVYNSSEDSLDFEVI